MTWSVSLRPRYLPWPRTSPKLALIKVQNEALLPVWWDHSTAENNVCQLSCQLKSFLTSSFQHLSYDARWASSLAAFHFHECFADQGSEHTGKWTSNWRDLRELIAWWFKFNLEQASTVLNPCLHLVFVSEWKPFKFEQADSTQFAVSVSAPAVVATAAVASMIFTLKDNWNWLAVAGSLSFHFRMRSESLHFFTQGM